MIPMALLQAIGQIQLFGGAALIDGWGTDPLRMLTVLSSMVAGTTFAIWLSNLITEQGIGQGMSIIIFGGIVARLPANIASLLSDPGRCNADRLHLGPGRGDFRHRHLPEGQRRSQCNTAKRGRKVYGGGATFCASIWRA
jgi:preprotein translocase subunit SecY